MKTKKKFDEDLAYDCVNYILNSDREEQDYYEYADIRGVNQLNWESTWDFNHIYVRALKAVGDIPDASRFKAQIKEG